MRLASFAWVIVNVLAVGCAPAAERLSSYSERSDVTRYRSATVPMVIEARSDTPGAARNLTVRAFGECPGRACMPDVIEISLANTGSARHADFESVTIQAGSTRHTWEDIWLGGPHQASIGHGEFLRFSVPVAFFVELANADDASIILGTTTFHLPHGPRRTFRQLQAAMGINDEMRED